MRFAIGSPSGACTCRSAPSPPGPWPRPRHDDVVRRLLDDVLRALVDRQVDVGDHPAERGGTRDRACRRSSADVRRMRMRRDDDVHSASSRSTIVEDRAGEVVAPSTSWYPRENGAFWKPPWWMSTTIVSTPAAAAARGTSVFTVSTSSRNSSPATPAASRSAASPRASSPMNGDLLAGRPCGSRTAGRAVSSVSSSVDVRCEVLEDRAGERRRRPGSRRPGGSPGSRGGGSTRFLPLRG